MLSLKPASYLISISMTLVCLLLPACDNSPNGLPGELTTDGAAESVQQELVGSWLREYEEKGVRARRLLVLEPDGSFREMVRITDSQGAVTEHSHEGTWLYDGTNFKRKYTRMDGRPPSRLNLPFAAFQLSFESRNEFIGIDNVHKNEVRYRRVQPETLL
jgi:hypothetical protein